MSASFSWIVLVKEFAIANMRVIPYKQTCRFGHTAQPTATLCLLLVFATPPTGVVVGTLQNEGQ